MADFTVPSLPKEERDQTLGRYMDAYSRLEGMLRQATALILEIDPRTAAPIFAVIYTSQSVDLLKAAAKLKLSKEGAERVRKLCIKIGNVNRRRNQIMHGYWTTYVVFTDDGMSAEWFRRYDHSDPDLMDLLLDDPKLLGEYNFTLKELDRATDHVEERIAELSSLVTDIRQLRPPPLSPEESFRQWVEDRRKPGGGVDLRLSQYRFP